MSAAKCHIVYQCYGNEQIFYECAFSLLSLWQQLKDESPDQYPVCIYTDKPEWFQRFKDCPLQLSYRVIDPPTLAEWKGSINFVHRVKIALLTDFVQQHEGNILYTDTDVVFTAGIKPMVQNIAAGRLYMHVMEGKINDCSNAIMTKLNNYLVKTGKKMKNGTPMVTAELWNAGVLGFNADHTGLLDEALQFTDEMYPSFPKHITEQFAFSVLFQQTAAVMAAAPYMVHYWNLKEVRAVLADFFRFFGGESWPGLVKYAACIQMPVLMQEKANFYSNRSITDKILKKTWTPNLPDWEVRKGEV